MQTRTEANAEAYLSLVIQCWRQHQKGQGKFTLNFIFLTVPKKIRQYVETKVEFSIVKGMLEIAQVLLNSGGILLVSFPAEISIA